MGKKTAWMREGKEKNHTSKGLAQTDKVIGFYVTCLQTENKCDNVLSSEEITYFKVTVALHS